MDDLIEGMVILNKYYCKIVCFNEMLRFFTYSCEMEESDKKRLIELGFAYDEDEDFFTYYPEESDEDEDDEYGNGFWSDLRMN